ncbi:hypothetical protein [Ideonella sp. A 288]|uniref:hypothetical protein n=1 Tax=Ideonella sp. A 288 TaxID=1962181 RepID=UPI001186BA31|nr:hypothetical protein [Ideonella sp. A 288]
MRRWQKIHSIEHVDSRVARGSGVGQIARQRIRGGTAGGIIVLRWTPRLSAYQGPSNPADERQRACGDHVVEDRTQTSAGSMCEFVPGATTGSFVGPSLVVSEIGRHFGIERSWEHGLASTVFQHGTNWGLMTRRPNCVIGD